MRNAQLWGLGLLACLCTHLAQGQPSPLPTYYPQARADEAQSKAAQHSRAEEVEAHAARLFNQGMYRAALQYFHQLVDLQAQNPSAWFGRGQCHEQLGHQPEALADYSQALALAPNFAEALFNRAMMQFNTGRYGFAIADFSQLIALDQPAATNAIYFGGTGNSANFAAQQVFSVAKAADGSAAHKATLYHARGLCKLRTQDAPGALADFAEALALAPRQADFWANKGLAHQQLGQHSQAADCFAKALAIDPQHGAALFQLAQMAPKSTATKRALDALIGQADDFAPAYASRGYLRFEQGDYSGALADLDSAIALGKTDYEVWLNRALAKDRLGQYAAAIADFHQAHQLKPDDEKALAGRASSHFKLKQYAKAVQYYAAAIALAPQQGHLYFNRALAYQKLGKNAEACHDLAQAQSLGQAAAAQARAKWCK